MISKPIVFILLAACAGCAQDDQRAGEPQEKARIRSTLGFSFAPPAGDGWTEEFGADQVMYVKKTDPSVVSFYTGALEVKMAVPLADMAQLTAFVRKKKDQWGNNGRYTGMSSSFRADPQHGSCVRYQMTANDHRANNLGSHPFLTVRSVGRFCLHPQDPSAAVDIFYSARYIPAYDANSLNAEGEAFLDSLAFHTPRGASGGGHQ